MHTDKKGWWHWPLAGMILYVLCAVLLALLLAGCVTQVFPNCVTVTTRGFGLRVVTANPSGGTVAPEIDLGFFANHIQVTPVSTNQMFTPDTASTFDLGQGLNPFATSINSVDTTGHVQVNDGTNPVVQPMP